MAWLEQVLGGSDNAEEIRNWLQYLGQSEMDLVPGDSECFVERGEAAVAGQGAALYDRYGGRVEAEAEVDVSGDVGGELHLQLRDGRELERDRRR